MTDLRPIYFAEARARLVGNRLRVYMALMEAGPSTPKELAARMGWDVTSVRPRFDDLRKMHAAELTGVRRNGEHEVRALTQTEMMTAYDDAARERVRRMQLTRADATFRELKQMEIFA